MGIIPDKFFVLGVSEDTIYKKIKSSFAANAEGKAVSDSEVDKIVQNAILEYNMYFWLVVIKILGI